MIDCGADWLHRLDAIAPTAILITHAHPDHAWGLAGGAPCPVYATKDTWAAISAYPIRDRQRIDLRKPFTLGVLRIEAFPVMHSIRAPAVGYRISTRCCCFFYVPDLVAIPNRSKALRGAQLYIGDGATLVRPMVRRRAGTLTGHTPIRTQLGWCAKERVPRAIFTHCGTQIVEGDGRSLTAALIRLARARGLEARFARDGMEITLPRRPDIRSPSKFGSVNPRRGFSGPEARNRQVQARHRFRE
jgi:phosphoribosyl 1,2-cyclic phosphodiesterase